MPRKPKTPVVELPVYESLKSLQVGDEVLVQERDWDHGWGAGPWLAGDVIRRKIVTKRSKAGWLTVGRSPQPFKPPKFTALVYGAVVRLVPTDELALGLRARRQGLEDVTRNAMVRLTEEPDVLENLPDGVLAPLCSACTGALAIADKPDPEVFNKE